MFQYILYNISMDIDMEDYVLLVRFYTLEYPKPATDNPLRLAPECFQIGMPLNGHQKYKIEIAILGHLVSWRVN